MEVIYTLERHALKCSSSSKSHSTLYIDVYVNTLLRLTIAIWGTKFDKESEQLVSVRIKRR